MFIIFDVCDGIQLGIKEQSTTVAINTDCIKCFRTIDVDGQEMVLLTLTDDKEVVVCGWKITESYDPDEGYISASGDGCAACLNTFIWEHKK